MQQPSAATRDQEPVRVLKFGGTSVATPERWEVVREVLLRRLAEGKRPIVVLSALAGVTNALERVVGSLRSGAAAFDLLEGIRRVHEALSDGLRLQDRSGFRAALDSLADLVRRAVAAGRVSDATHAEIVGHGELLSTSLGAAWLRQRGLDVALVDARAWLRMAVTRGEGTHHPYLSVACEHRQDPDLRRAVLEGPAVTVTQGFIARNALGETVLLGRGGSDTSASYFAAKVAAEAVEIWTDVPGMFTADPRVVAAARLLARVSYDEAEAFAASGAKVLHPRCLGPLREHGIPLTIHWTSRPEFEGTRVDGGARKRGVKGVALRDKLLLVTVDHAEGGSPAGCLSELMAGLERLGCTPDLLSNGEGCTQLTLDPRTSPDLDTRLPDLVERLGRFGRVTVLDGQSAVSLVGHELCGSVESLAPFLRRFAGTKPPMLSQSPHGHSVTFVAPDEVAATIHENFHSALLEATPEIAFGGPSWSTLTAPRESEPVELGEAPLRKAN